MKKASIIFVSLMVCAILLCGCTSAPASSAVPTSTASPSSTAPVTSTAAVPVSVLNGPQGGPPSGLTPQYGGTLKVIYASSPTNLGAPWKNMMPFDAQLSRFMLENLVGLDSQGLPIPQLATKWDSDPVAKTVTFTLRQGVNFQDGTPFNAAAVKWNLDTYRSGQKIDLKAVTSVDVIDDYHVKISLSSWNPLFVQSISSSYAGKMVSPTAAQKLGDSIMLNPVGTGPFKLVSYQPNVALKFTRNENYWQKGLPYLDGVEIDFVADPVVALASFTKGEGQVIYGVSPGDATKLKAAGNNVDAAGVAILSMCGDSKNSSSPFSNIKVRQAIAYAIDNKTIVDSVYNGFDPATSQLALPGMQAYNSSIQGYPYNPAKAQDLLAQAGYSTSNPLSVKFTYPSDPDQNNLWTAVQSYLAKVGINITLQPLSYGAFTQAQHAGWNNQLMAFTFPYGNPEMPYTTALTMDLNAKAGGFVSVWVSDDFDALYNQALLENDMGKREVDYEQLNKMAIDTYCLVIPVMGLQTLTAKSAKLHDFGMANKTVAEFLPETAWLSK